MGPDTTAGQDEAELERISLFKQGFTEFLDQQNVHSSACQQLLMSSTLTREDRVKLHPVNQSVDKNLGEVQSHVRKLRSNLSPAHLEKEAAREAHSFFDAEPDDNRGKFLEFFKTFEYLLEFWREASSLWIDVNNKINVSGITDGTDFKKQFVTYRMGPSLEGLESLEVFLRRMARILFGTDSLVAREGHARKLYERARYVDGFEYRFSAVFTDNLDDTLRQIGVDSPLEDIMGMEESAGPARKRRSPQAPAATSSDPRESPRLDASGTQPWNNNPYYYLAYDPFLLNRERESYVDVVHLDTHMGADQQTIRGDIIRNFSRRTQAIETERIEEEYEQFLFTYFDLVVDISMLNVGVSPTERDLFLFHLGPQTFFHLARRFLQEAKTGTFHRKKAGARVVVKFLPVELMKKIIIHWWHDKVLANVGDERDDYAAMKRLARQVRGTFEQVLKTAVAERSELQGKTMSDILRSDHIHDIFGGPALIIVRRYLRFQ